MKRKRREAIPVRDLLGRALRDLGMPSMRLTERIIRAWNRLADPEWQGVAAPRQFVGGVLVVGVSSAALRQELAQFHRDRLLEVLRAALPDVTLVGLRFTADAEGPATDDNRLETRNEFRTRPE